MAHGFILSLDGWLYCLGAVLRQSVVAEDRGMGRRISHPVVARNQTEIQEGAGRHAYISRQAANALLSTC